MKKILAAILISVFLSPTVPSIAQNIQVTSELLTELGFRNIGPAVTGGRIHDVEAVPGDPATVYVATASGGIWKSSNKGTTWRPVFDDQPVSTFGDLAISPSDPQIIWAGTGEQNNRQSTSWGNGVYRSNDGGDTWIHLGLEETRHIGRVRVHPEDPDIAYVAALGNLWKPSRERGVYKTTNGGMSWSHILSVDSLTGAVDLVIHPADPNILYAATYQRLRRTWGFNGGGPGSGIYRTTDAGQTWHELTNGIPQGDKGRIGLTIAQTNPRILYAIVEHAEASGVYRTENGGESWVKLNDLNPRPMYYSHITCDPTDENRVWVLGVEFYMSEDGGQTFRQMPTRPTYDVGVHSDHHTIWIDPGNPEHFYLAGDAGLHETWDRGETYIRMNNFPIGQFYAVGVDMRDPYYVYGGLQDNHSFVGPSATRRWIGIINDDWSQIGFGDGMYQQPDPTDYRYVFTNAENGRLTRVDARTGDMLDIRPFPDDSEETYRFDWVTPSLLSGHNPRKIYFGGNRLFMSSNRGVSWERTGDLTRQIDRDTLSLMGVKGSEKMLSKNDGTSSYGEITTIAESPLSHRILWVGTDDGNVQLSRDGGKAWTNVSGNIQGVPNGTYVSRVIASSRERGIAYVSLDAHRDGDFAPYVFKTTNFGETWRKLTEGLPDIGSVNVIIEHPSNQDLLFLGTEHALFVSTTAGEEWTKFDPKLPTTLYDDLKIHPGQDDLIVATHGRSVWILDDLTPLVKWSAEVAHSKAHLFPIRPATIFFYFKSTSYRGQGAYAGENPPFGALIDYYLAEPADSVQIEIRNRAGKLVRRVMGKGSPGTIHRTTWDLRHEPPPFKDRPFDRAGLVKSENILPKLPRPVDPLGPFVAPSTYTVTLKAGDVASSQSVRVLGDPKMEISGSQWRKRESFLLELLELQHQIWDAAERAESLSKQLSARRDSLAKLDLLPPVLEATADSAKARSKRLNGLRNEIYSLAGECNGRGVRQGSLYPPTKTHKLRKLQLTARLRRELETLEGTEHLQP